MQKKKADKSRSLKPPAKRVPIHHAIDLRFPTFEGLVTKVSSNLSTTGMFVQSGTPAEVGSEFSFRFHIEEWSPITGEARVVWVRKESESPERPAGMGVEFTHLDAQSRRMIRWLVDKNLQEGGAPFDLAKLPAGASRSRQSLATGRADSLTGSSKSKTSSVPLILIWVVILGAVASGAYYWWESQASRESDGFGSRKSSEQGQAKLVSEDLATDTDETAAPEKPQLDSDPAGASRLVEDWAAAWEDRRPDDLLKLYADEFTPSTGLSRDEWESQLRESLAQPGFILVAVSGLNVSFPDLKTANATFYRSIRSDSANNTGRLSLDLVARDGEWLIVREIAVD